MTVYLNWNGENGLETIDEFTRGVDAPAGYREFRKYVREMVSEYHMAGMGCYQSSRACKAWRTSSLSSPGV